MIRNNYRRGDIYLARLNPVVGSEQRGTRPVVIVQNNLANKTSPTLIVVPITSIKKKAKLQSHIVITGHKYIFDNAMILVEQIRTIDKRRIKRYMGRLSYEDLKRVDVALKKTLMIGGN